MSARGLTPAIISETMSRDSLTTPWFNSGFGTHPVGKKKPNAWGFSITCTGTSGSGVRIGLIVITTGSHQRVTQPDPRRVPSAYHAAAVGAPDAEYCRSAARFFL